jgi:hypothetical protein
MLRITRGTPGHDCLEGGAHADQLLFGWIRACTSPQHGDPTPSPADETLTKDFFVAARLVGLQGLDHLIVGAGRAWAFSDRRFFDIW